MAAFVRLKLLYKMWFYPFSPHSPSHDQVKTPQSGRFSHDKSLSNWEVSGFFSFRLYSSGKKAAAFRKRSRPAIDCAATRSSLFSKNFASLCPVKRTQQAKPAGFLSAYFSGLTAGSWETFCFSFLSCAPQSTQQRSKVSTVGSGHGHRIYGSFFNLSSQTRQDWGSQGRQGAFFTVQGQATLSWLLGSRRGRAEVGGWRFKGQREEKSGVTESEMINLSSVVGLTFH